MAAFNYIVADVDCPGCKRRTMLRAQTHIASDYEGDEHGRLMGQDYRLGERMRWFAADHADFDTWMTWGCALDGRVEELCGGTCEYCGMKVYVLIEFVDVTPTAVLKVSVSPPRK
jgi:hypothetical protein